MTYLTSEQILLSLGHNLLVLVNFPFTSGHLLFTKAHSTIALGDSLRMLDAALDDCMESCSLVLGRNDSYAPLFIHEQDASDFLRAATKVLIRGKDGANADCGLLDILRRPSPRRFTDRTS
jgi:hypothetical protein